MTSTIDDYLAAIVTNVESESVLANKICQLTKLDKLVKQCLGSELANHFQVINYRDACLVLAVNNASWATKIRYQIPQLLSQLRQSDNMPIQDIHCLVRQPINTTQSVQQKRQPGSGVKILAEVANTIEDPALRKALLKLADLGFRI